MTALPTSFDLFCRVIDNYGDIGVCWRLARQLAQPPYAARVRLWVDDLPRCHALVPAIVPVRQQQWHDRVEIRQWDTATASVTPAQVVIEAFGCDPPAAFVHTMTAETIWINLEYLSAESWIEHCHGLPSPQPNGVPKWFFFPGFTRKTGGLLREPDVFARRDAWQADPHQRQALWQSLGVPEIALQALQQGARQVLLFCYPHAPVARFLQGLLMCAAPTVVFACPGTVNASCHTLVRDSHVQLCEIAFVAQTTFDMLLWGSDLNCVRGEDSIVRALWAGRPLLWHIYPQVQDAHLIKLHAWLARAPYPTPVGDLTQGWNAQTASDADQIAPLLSESLAPATYPQWQCAAQQWSHTLAQQDDLASTLVAFCTHQGQTR